MIQSDEVAKMTEALVALYGVEPCSNEEFQQYLQIFQQPHSFMCYEALGDIAYGISQEAQSQLIVNLALQLENIDHELLMQLGDQFYPHELHQMIQQQLYKLQISTE